MKEHWSAAPPPIQRRIDAALRYPGSPAESWMNAAAIAWSCGYDLSPPPRTTTDRLAELRQTAPSDAGAFTLTHSIELAAERQAATLFAGRRAWAAGPSTAELTAQRRAESARVETERAIEARAQELLAEQQAQTLATARTRARKEISR